MGINGKHYAVNIKDFAAENGVSVRTVQKKLVAERYKKDLEDEFIRTNADGTWLTDEACRFLKTTFKTQAIGFVSDSKLEGENEKLRQQLFEVQQKFTDYVATVTPLLQQANEQLVLAERSEENKKRAEALEADLSAEKEKAEKLTLELEKTKQEASERLLEEQNRKLTLKERFFGRKGK